MRELVSLSNTYIDETGTAGNAQLLGDIAQYLTYLLKVFGVIPHSTGIGFPIQEEGEGANIVRSSYIGIIWWCFRKKQSCLMLKL